MLALAVGVESRKDIRDLIGLPCIHGGGKGQKVPGSALIIGRHDRIELMLRDRLG
jgi:hypothetical protein